MLRIDSVRLGNDGLCLLISSPSPFLSAAPPPSFFLSLADHVLRVDVSFFDATSLSLSPSLAGCLLTVPIYCTVLALLSKRELSVGILSLSPISRIQSAPYRLASLSLSFSASLRKSQIHLPDINWHYSPEIEGGREAAGAERCKKKKL